MWKNANKSRGANLKRRIIQRFPRPALTLAVGHRSVISLAALLAFAGACRREPPAVPPAPPVVSPRPAPSPSVTAPQPAQSAPQPAPAQEPIEDGLPTAPNGSSLKNPVSKELTGALHLYLTDHRKLPADFNTLVKERYIKSLPQPPAGKKFAVDRSRLQVVAIDP
jgi:hypothetical protein